MIDPLRGPRIPHEQGFNPFAQQQPQQRDERALPPHIRAFVERIKNSIAASSLALDPSQKLEQRRAELDQLLLGQQPAAPLGVPMAAPQPAPMVPQLAAPVAPPAPQQVQPPVQPYRPVPQVMPTGYSNALDNKHRLF